MASRALELEITRKGRPVDAGRFNVTADPDNAPALRAELHGWLAANGWSRSLWSQFEMRIRYAGSGKIRATVRA